MVRSLAPENCITAEELRLLVMYDPKTGIMRWAQRKPGRQTNKEAGTLSKAGYRQVVIDYKIYTVHRLAWLYVYGNFPKKDEEIDHINRNKSDNRIENLRLATKIENGQNRKENSNNKLGLKGVCFFGGKYISQIKVFEKRIKLGCFDSPELAYAAYIEASRKYFGEFHNDALKVGG
jgi:hypothetical protein